MLRNHGRLPFDESLYAMTVTVYHREGLTRQVLAGVHFEPTVTDSTVGAVTGRQRSFLLVIPFLCDVQPGDKIAVGAAPEVDSWLQIDGFTVGSVRRCTLRGQFCHMEVRG